MQKSNLSHKNSTLSKNYRLILSAVHMVYRLVNSTYNLKELSLRLTRLLCQFIHASSASIYILDAERKNVILCASFDNQINIMIDKKSELKYLPEKEIKVTKGASILDKRFIGLPLIADDNIGGIFIKRKLSEPPFSEFDREMLSVFAEQAVTAIKNLQLYERQEQTIISSIKFMGKFLEKQKHVGLNHTPVYFKIVQAMAERLNVGQEGIKCLEYASHLHDAGIVDIPYDILCKRTQLTREELRIIRGHPLRSVELSRSIEFLKPVLPIILYHHERYDGTGYPAGLKKEQIPLGARIFAVVDAFEAMINDRPYRKTRTVKESIEELKRNSGTQFDPRVIKVFCELTRQKKFRNYLSSMKQ